MLASVDVFRPVDMRELSRHEVGPETLRWVPYTAITPLPQQRTSIEPEGLERLMSALTVTDGDGRQNIDLLHPPTVNIISSRTKAREYVRVLNDVWDLDHPVSAIRPHFVDGNDRVYPAQIAGHRRMVAIGLLLPKLGFTEDETDVLSSVHEDLDFMSALDIQYKENQHQGLTPWQDARAIASRYKAGIDKGEFTTFKSCADTMGVSPEKVSQAWRFFQLPDFVQDAVRDFRSTRLHYGKAVLLYDVAKAAAETMTFRNRYDRDMATDMAVYLKEQIADMSLIELTKNFDDDETRHYEYQVSLHKNAVAKVSIADAAVYVRTNVADLNYQRDRGESMSSTDYAAIARAKQLTQLAATRTDTYHVTSMLLNQLQVDAATVAANNTGKLSDTGPELIVHSPFARRVIESLTALLVDVDCVMPDEEFLSELNTRKNELLVDLMALGAENRLPDEIHHAVATYLPVPSSNGEVSLFEELAS